MVKLIIGLSFVWKKYWCKPCVSIDFWMDGHLHRTLSVSMMKCVSHQDVSMREGLHFCKSSSQLAYLSCWREREVIRTTSVLFICVSKLQFAQRSPLWRVKRCFFGSPCVAVIVNGFVSAVELRTHSHTFYSCLPLCHLSEQILLWCSALFFKPLLLS